MARLVKNGQAWDIELEPEGLEQDIARLEYKLQVQNGVIERVATYGDARTVYEAITASMNRVNEFEKMQRELPAGPIAKWMSRLEPVLTNNPNLRYEEG